LDCCASARRARPPSWLTGIQTASITACDISPARLKTMAKRFSGRRPNINFRVLDATQLPFQNQFDLGALRRALQAEPEPWPATRKSRHRITPEELSTPTRSPAAPFLISAMRATTRREAGLILFHLLPGSQKEETSSRSERGQMGAKQKSLFGCSPGREQIKALENDGTLHPGAADRLFPNKRPRPLPAHLFPASIPATASSPPCLVREIRNKISQSRPEES